MLVYLPGNGTDRSSLFVRILAFGHHGEQVGLFVYEYDARFVQFEIMPGTAPFAEFVPRQGALGKAPRKSVFEMAIAHQLGGVLRKFRTEARGGVDGFDKNGKFLGGQGETQVVANRLG